jgi:hypothetical protein
VPNRSAAAAAKIKNCLEVINVGTAFDQRMQDKLGTMFAHCQKTLAAVIRFA